MYQELAFHIDLNWESYVADSHAYLSKLYEIVDFVYQYKGTVYYNVDQIRDFRQCQQIDENFTKSIGNLLELILKNAKSVAASKYYFSVVFSGENTQVFPVNNSALSSIEPSQKVSLLSLTEQDNLKTLFWAVSNTEFGRVVLRILKNRDDIVKWIRENSADRKFNFEDKRHGENGVGNRSNKSLLLCSAQRAQVLLNAAIPDFREKGKQLFCFDDDKKTFIEFYFEGNIPQHLWHGFHLRAENYASRVPTTVRRYFGR